MKPENLLPRGGEALYFGSIFLAPDADRHLQNLIETIPWSNDEVVLFGKRHVMARQVAWYGDPGCDYGYSGTNKAALPWTAPLLELKTTVEQLAGHAFNSCLLNFYHHGGEGMGWHSDDEKSLGDAPVIASLSLGAERKFAFRHRTTGDKASLTLENGSLLVMGPGTQAHWQHSLPKTKRVTDPRINLTFRQIIRRD